MTHIALACFLVSFTLLAEAANTPCSGSKGGIDHCEGSKFVCNDGSYSESTKDCRTYFTPTCTAPQIVQNGTCVTPTPTVSLNATPNTIESGTASTLVWSSSNATSCIASGDWSGIFSPSGSQSTGILTTSKAYTLTCSGIAGAANRTVTVTVNPAQPTCESPQVLQNGACVTPQPSCVAPQTLVNGQCVTPIPNCEAPNVLVNDECVEPSQRDDNLLQLNYKDFTLWLDCNKRGATKFEYVTVPDTNKAKRSNSFFLDPNVPANCQQLSTKTYGKGYDRGHLIPANHFDYSDEAVKSTNVMTNIVPQVASMNRGAWLATEEIIECYRDVADLTVMGGVIWGNNHADDYFEQSHGVETPDAFWKTIIKTDQDSEQVISWIIPNS